MGYTTDFHGEWAVTPPLTPEQVTYLHAFARVRACWNPVQLEGIPDPIREAVGLPVGNQGRYFTGHLRVHADANREVPWPEFKAAPGFAGVRAGWIDRQAELLVKPTLFDSPTDEPDYPCQWVPTPEGDFIEWDQGEKFYDYVEWIEYLIHHFFKRWGNVLDGDIEWFGEEHWDRGIIRIVGNQVSIGRLKTSDVIWDFGDAPAS